MGLKSTFPYLTPTVKAPFSPFGYARKLKASTVLMPGGLQANLTSHLEKVEAFQRTPVVWCYAALSDRAVKPIVK